MLVVSQKAYIFEEMSLVASQLPLTREPRKECGARDSITFARVVRVELFGAMSGEESVERRLIVRRVGNPSVLRRGEFDVSKCWWCCKGVTYF